MQKVYLAFGGNIGNVDERIQMAINLLCAKDSNSAKLELIGHSSYWYTEPFETGEEQEWFTNSVGVFHCAISPEELLEKVQDVELMLGRVREEGKINAARTIDIDILDYEDFECDTENLTLPHPRMFKRAFVLVPLQEIAPDYSKYGKNVDEYLSEIEYKVFRKSIFQK